MSAIKNMYGKTKLSEDKKAELKAALGERFPRYADSMEDKTEVIGMNDNKVYENGGRIMVRSKWRTGAVIAAAAVVAVMGGMKLARDQYIERSHMTPASHEEDNSTTDSEDSVKEYSQKEGYIADVDKSTLSATKTIYNSACEALADIKALDYELVLGEEKMITSEMVKQSQESEITHEDGKCSVLEFAATISKYSEGCDLDISQYDYAVDFMFDENGKKVVQINYVYIYLDAEHKTFYSYPPYGSQGGIIENGIAKQFKYDSSCAKKLYEEAEEAIKYYNENGERFAIDSLNMTAVEHEYLYMTDDHVREDIEENDKMRFAQALMNEGSMTMQLRKDSNNFVIKFTHDSKGNVNGVEKVYVQVFKDEADENGEHKNERFVYPDENKMNEMTVTIPDVAGKDPDEASEELVSLGLHTELYEMFSDTVPKGTVISTEPAAGADSEFGRYVTINISQGPLGQKIIFPDVRGKNVNEAVSELESLGFSTTIESINSGIYPKGTVADTDPEGEDESECAYERGKNVTLYVSTGKFVVPKEETEGEKSVNVQ
ncbi:PASTA domain-containing protein [Ruminococcus albus]|uniref:PASTA domain-containing protein n=1 Tax=Ruminococcus albus TaxID=1264 RepID=A0A1H7LLT7_RUMAL|nr:PASTA domain-containing protein [Ruminococcus albus]SEK99425.1 PASTA domain-containing protein [Ruminococcus albus]